MVVLLFSLLFAGVIATPDVTLSLSVNNFVNVVSGDNLVTNATVTNNEATAATITWATTCTSTTNENCIVTYTNCPTTVGPSSSEICQFTFQFYGLIADDSTRSVAVQVGAIVDGDTASLSQTVTADLIASMAMMFGLSMKEPGRGVAFTATLRNTGDDETVTSFAVSSPSIGFSVPGFAVCPATTKAYDPITGLRTLNPYCQVNGTNVTFPYNFLSDETMTCIYNVLVCGDVGTSIFNVTFTLGSTTISPVFPLSISDQTGSDDGYWYEPGTFFVEGTSQHAKTDPMHMNFTILDCEVVESCPEEFPSTCQWTGVWDCYDSDFNSFNLATSVFNVIDAYMFCYATICDYSAPSVKFCGTDNEGTSYCNLNWY